MAVPGLSAAPLLLGGKPVNIIPVPTFTVNHVSSGYELNSQAWMYDDNFGTGFITQNASNPGYGTAIFRADYGQIVYLPVLKVAPYLIASYGDNCSIEHSVDAASWSSVGMTSGSTLNTLKSYPLNVEARYLRLVKTASLMGISEFQCVNE